MINARTNVAQVVLQSRLDERGPDDHSHCEAYRPTCQRPPRRVDRICEKINVFEESRRVSKMSEIHHQTRRKDLAGSQRNVQTTIELRNEMRLLS